MGPRPERRGGRRGRGTVNLRTQEAIEVLAVLGVLGASGRGGRRGRGSPLPPPGTDASRRRAAAASHSARCHGKGAKRCSGLPRAVGPGAALRLGAAPGGRSILGWVALVGHRPTVGLYLKRLGAAPGGRSGRREPCCQDAAIDAGLSDGKPLRHILGWVALVGHRWTVGLCLKRAADGEHGAARLRVLRRPCGH